MDPLQQEIIELKLRVERLEQIVAQLGHVPLPPNLAPVTPAYEAEVRALVDSGNILLAIKVYRQHTRCSLLEAKLRVEAMRR